MDEAIIEIRAIRRRCPRLRPRRARAGVAVMFNLGLVDISPAYSFGDEWYLYFTDGVCLIVAKTGTVRRSSKRYANREQSK